MKTEGSEVLNKLAAQNIRLLIERQKAGKPLTKAQLQQIENFLSGQSAQKVTWAKSLQELASMFGVTRMTIKLWIQKGAPAANASGFYPIEEWQKWVEAHGEQRGDDGEDLDKSRLTARQVYLRNQLLEIELERARGEVMHIDDVRSKLYQTFDVCRRIQLRIGPTLAARVAGMTPAEISKEITRAIRESYVEIKRWADEQGRDESGTETGEDASSGLDSLREEREET